VHSFKVRVVLAEKELAWTAHRVELLKLEHLRPEYLCLNPNGVVPTLVHDGKVVVESSVICQYLDETFPEPSLMPPDPYARAQARIWLKLFDDVAHPAIRQASFELLYRPFLARMPAADLELLLARHPDPARAQRFRDAACGAANAAAITDAVLAFRRIIARMDAALKRNEWLAGVRSTVWRTSPWRRSQNGSTTLAWAAYRSRFRTREDGSPPSWRGRGPPGPALRSITACR
jgi:glutathione S-transferase